MFPLQGGKALLAIELTPKVYEENCAPIAREKFQFGDQVHAEDFLANCVPIAKGKKPGRRLRPKPKVYVQNCVPIALNAGHLQKNVLFFLK